MHLSEIPLNQHDDGDSRHGTIAALWGCHNINNISIEFGFCLLHDRIDTVQIKCGRLERRIVHFETIK